MLQTFVLQENEHIGNVNLICRINRTQSSTAINKLNNVNVKEHRLGSHVRVIPGSDSSCLVTVVARAAFKYFPKKQ